MAAEELARAGLSVDVYDAKPSVGRKFLMAGKSGLNLTKDETLGDMLPQYAEAAAVLRPALESFDAVAVQDWAGALGQAVFTGSTGRVFPRAMKASPLLRAWLRRLEHAGVRMHTRWRWCGWAEDGALRFDTPRGAQVVAADVVILALGGASWARLGSDGEWAALLGARGIDLAPFAPANVGATVAWSSHMERFLGVALKSIALKSGAFRSRGEAVISRSGLEGGGIYEVSRGLREGSGLRIDLLPDWTVDQVAEKIARPRGKASLSNHLRKVLKLEPARIALAQECARPLATDPKALARTLKSLSVPVTGLRPMDEAISTAGGVPFAALDAGLMLRAAPGVFCAGEMLDWEAPTGGYLITGCLATGRWAGRAAATWAAAPH
ncbi:TIGR03862 family flavoprotein [Sulfitobacter sabulilitoris]|uniref:TIGR03862 family flavoprotein n=2 Tax=Sulfitobacter sabulilitoris TaxID=2562655 RepID=A0A5S3PG62_9RHOB|nr:TIGR03862 family flavoprotein [Sulfitobacter sabulilitoris]